MSVTWRDKFYLVFLIHCLYFTVPAASQANLSDLDVNGALILNLNKSVTWDDREIVGYYTVLNTSDNLAVMFENISADLEFLVFQVHTQFQSVVLYRNDPFNHEHVNGTNVGMISVLKKMEGVEPQADTFFIQNPDPNNTVTAYISVLGYFPKDPYPGGCNLVYPLRRCPNLNVTTTTDYILLDAAPASIDSECNMPNADVEVTFYMLYLPEMTYSFDDYLKGIKVMMSLKGIEKNGWKLPQTADAWEMRRMLAAYPGTGVILTAVARFTYDNDTRYSVYVPSHSYGCTDTDEYGCILPVDIVSPLLCGILFFVGLFVSHLGHRFFKTEMFLAGMFAGFIVTYILISVIETAELTTQALVTASTVSGLLFGAIWLLFWWLYGIPVIAVIIPSLNVGFLLAAVVFYRLPAYTIDYLKDDFNFWSIFILITLLTGMAMLSATYSANLLCCAVLGGFCTMYTADYALGSNLKYIIVNIVRRAAVPGYNVAILAPPFQYTDCLVTVLWVSTSLSGWAFHHWYNRNRPPFPPPPRSVLVRMPEDTFSTQATNYGALTEDTQRQVRNITTIRHQLTGAPVVSRTYSERTYLLGNGN